MYENSHKEMEAYQLDVASGTPDLIGTTDEMAGVDPQPRDSGTLAETAGGSKSEIIAQLQRRMEKIQRKKVKAFGTKNRPSAPMGAPSITPMGTMIDQHSPIEPASPKSDRAKEVVESPHQDISTHGLEGPLELTLHKDALIPGEVMDTPMGEVWRNRKRYPGWFHGNGAVDRYLAVGLSMAAFAKDDRLAQLAPEGALFIDTETTGLSSGAGTLAFLVGCGFFEDGVFMVEQYFCREPVEEPAQLEALSHRLANAQYLVSFNGKSFDMPLINTRYILNRMKNPGYNLPHLDLLHVCRRIFKRRLSDRSLQNLERVILGFHRQGDIQGALIPEAYRDYLFGHGEAQIAAILEHNLLDIVALAALAGRLDEIYSDPAAVAHAADHLGLAKEAFLAGETEIGDLHLAAADDMADGDDRRIALHMQAREALRRKAYGQAVTLYHRVLEIDEADVDAHLQLAKLYEHRLKDFDLALHHAKEAAALEGEAAGERRVLRIEKKKVKKGLRKW